MTSSATTSGQKTPLLAGTVGEETIRGWIGNAKVFGITIADCLEYYATKTWTKSTPASSGSAQRMAPFTLINGRFFDGFHSIAR
ncbi:MAG: hypothetical protein R2856_00640 [Caldilineaceae bacterium]